MEAPQKNLGRERGRVRRIAMLTEDGAQVNVLAVSELPAATLIRGLVARWGRQGEPASKYEVERWGINHLDGRRVEEYPPTDTLIPQTRRGVGSIGSSSSRTPPKARRGRRWVRAPEDDPERGHARQDADRATWTGQRDLMAAARQRAQAWRR
ncbi:MAG: hypothetical protein QM767_14430 [Anaeromyxobacter sp.]